MLKQLNATVDEQGYLDGKSNNMYARNNNVGLNGVAGDLEAVNRRVAKEETV